MEHSQSHFDNMILEQVTPANSFGVDTPYKSDHSALSYITRVIIENKKGNIVTSYDKTNYDEITFRKTVSALSWFNDLSMPTAQAMLRMFIKVLAFSLEKHAHLNKKFIKYNPKPTILGRQRLDNEFKKASLNRQTTFNFFRLKPSTDSWTAYKEAKNCLSNLINTKQETISLDLASNLVNFPTKNINQIRRSKPTFLQNFAWETHSET